MSQNNTDWVIYGNTTAIDRAAADCSFINKDGYTSYMLYNGQFVRINNNGGLAAHRCVLNVANSTTGSARVLTIATTDAMGLEEVKDDSYYTIDGRRLNGKPATKGVYIYNGKKICL